MKNKIFLWEGINRNGMKVKGEQEATNTQATKTILREAGITPLKIKRKSLSLFYILRNKIKSQDVTSFTKDLSILISANIPLASALEMTEKNARKITLKKLIHKIRKQVTSGKSLSDTLRNCRPYFDDIFCSLIEAGEHSGTLDIMLKNITQYHEKSIKLKHTIKKAILYPIIVLVISLSVTTALLVFIVPQFADLFQNVGAELPILTQIIVKISDKIYINLKIIFIVILLCLITIRILVMRSESFSILLDKLFLKIPIFGSIIKQSILTRSFNTLSVLLRTGVPLTEALHLASQISNNRIYQKSLY